MLLNNIKIFKCNPSNELLTARYEDQAYCISNLPEEIVVFFTTSGEVNLDTSKMSSKIMVCWLDVERSIWLDPHYLENYSNLELKADNNGICAVVVKSI